MPKFSSKSIGKLHTCEADLQILFSYVIKHFDCTVVYGHRSPDQQLELYKKGRTLLDGVWTVTDSKKVVTKRDGYNLRSAHNNYPSTAVDVAPYPTLYSDENTARHFAGFVLGVAAMLKEYGAIDHTIISGVDWDNDRDLNDQKFLDILHFEIKR